MSKMRYVAEGEVNSEETYRRQEDRSLKKENSEKGNNWFAS